MFLFERDVTALIAYLFECPVYVFALHVKNNVKFFRSLDLPERIAIGLSLTKLVQSYLPVALLCFFEKVLQLNDT